MRRGRGFRAVGQHSSASSEWGTPENIVALAQAALGRFDVDPASSAHWNTRVGAERFITKAQDGLRTPWLIGAPRPCDLGARRRRAAAARATAFVNPPGEKTGELVAQFWRVLAGYHELGWLSAGIWVGFSVEQLARLQRIGAASHPLEHVTLIPCRRLHYQNRRKSARSSKSKGQPGHASFVTLLASNRAEVDRFCRLGAELGHVVVGDRWR